MGTGMGTRLHSLPGGDGDGTKVWYSLGLGMGMGMTFFYGNGYRIAKLVPVPPLCHPYPTRNRLPDPNSDFFADLVLFYFFVFP